MGDHVQSGIGDGPWGAKFQLPRSRRWLMLLFIFVVSLLSYANSLDNEFVWDDPLFIVQNPEIRELSNIGGFFVRPWSAKSAVQYQQQGRIGWRPLALVSYSIDYALFGPSAFGFHLTNVLLHGVASCLVLLLLLQLTSPRSALLGGLLFAVHPIHAEAVNVITYRTTLLAGVFYLLGLWLHVRGRRGDGTWWHHWLLVPLCYLAACLSKEPGITLAAVIVLYDLSDGGSIRSRLAHYAPLAVVGASYLFARSLITEAAKYNYFEGVSGLNVVLTQFKVYLHNLSVMLWPDPLCAFYEWTIMAPANGIGEIEVIAGLLMFLITVAAMLSMGLRRRGAWLFVPGMFLLTLAPYVHIIPHFDVAGDRFLYIPSIAWALGFAVLAQQIFGLASDRRRNLALSLIVLMLLIYSALTLRRNEHWQSNRTMHEQTVRDFPYSLNSLVGLGGLHFEQGNYRQAVVYFERALKIAPQLKPIQRMLQRARSRLKQPSVPPPNPH